MCTVMTIIFEIIVLRILKPTNSLYIPDSSIIFCILISSLAIIVDMYRSETLKGLQGFFLFSYFLRIIILFIDIYMKGIIHVFSSGSDTEDFFERMVLIAHGNEYHGSHLFVRMFGQLYRYIGISRLYAQYIIVLFSMCAILYTVKSMNLLGVTFESKRMSLIVMAVLPTYVCLSCILLRESVIYMLISFSVYYFVKWYCDENDIYLMLAISFSLFASSFHSGCIGIALGIVLGRVLFDKNERRVHITITNIIIGAILLLTFIYIYQQYGNVFFSKFLRIESIEDIGSTKIKGGSSYAIYVGDSKTPLRMAIYTIPRVFFYICSPLPFQWRGMADISAFFMNSLFYVLSLLKTIFYLHSNQMRKRINVIDNHISQNKDDVLLAKKKNSYLRSELDKGEKYRMIRDSWRDRGVERKMEEEQSNMVFLLLIICVVTIFIFAWGVTNTGTALRHRDKIASVFVLMLSLQPWNFYIY